MDFSEFIGTFYAYTYERTGTKLLKLIKSCQGYKTVEMKRGK